jgi:hypothetical protein
LFLVFRLTEDTFTPFSINAEMPPEDICHLDKRHGGRADANVAAQRR